MKGPVFPLLAILLILPVMISAQDRLVGPVVYSYRLNKDVQKSLDLIPINELLAEDSPLGSTSRSLVQVGSYVAIFKNGYRIRRGLLLFEIKPDPVDNSKLQDSLCCDLRSDLRLCVQRIDQFGNVSAGSSQQLMFTYQVQWRDLYPYRRS